MSVAPGSPPSPGRIKSSAIFGRPHPGRQTKKKISTFYPPTSRTHGHIHGRPYVRDTRTTTVTAMVIIIIIITIKPSAHTIRQPHAYGRAVRRTLVGIRFRIHNCYCRNAYDAGGFGQFFSRSLYSLGVSARTTSSAASGDRLFHVVRRVKRKCLQVSRRGQ